MGAARSLNDDHGASRHKFFPCHKFPAFEGTWGKPFLLGPGSIHFAHTDEERVPKAELVESVQIYQKLVRQLLQQ